jgi:hypothetical protein
MAEHVQSDTPPPRLIALQHACKLLDEKPRNVRRWLQRPDRDQPRLVRVGPQDFFVREQLIQYLRAKAAEVGFEEEAA